MRKLKHSMGLSSIMFWGQGQYCQRRWRCIFIAHLRGIHSTYFIAFYFKTSQAFPYLYWCDMGVILYNSYLRITQNSLLSNICAYAAVFSWKPSCSNKSLCSLSPPSLCVCVRMCVTIYVSLIMLLPWPSSCICVSMFVYLFFFNRKEF